MTEHPEFETWWNNFRPIANHIEPDSAYDGCMFETYGPELDYVLSVPVAHVWTLVDGDDGSIVLDAGYRYVNRIGYLITEQAWDSSVVKPITVLMEDAPA